MTSHDLPSTTTPQAPPSPTSPVELTTLHPTDRTTEDPISPLSPANETFATPPTSARHSTLGPSGPGGALSSTEAAPDSVDAGQSEPQDHASTSETAPASTSDATPTATGTQEPPAALADDAPLNEKAEPSIQPTAPTPSGGIGAPTSASALHLPATSPPSPADDTSVCLTLLHPSGLRHPFVINAAYLKKHHVAQGDPWAISVYTLKELIWRDWRDEWEERPVAPGSVRLISFGRLLDERSKLRDLNLSQTQANVVHMTVRPADLEDEEGGAKKGKRRRRTSSVGPDESDGGGCCRCCTM